MISLSSSSPAQKCDKNEEVKQGINDFVKGGEQNLVLYTDKDLIQNISNKNQGGQVKLANNLEVKSGITSYPENSLKPTYIPGKCADCGCCGRRNVLDPPFSPKYEPQDLPTPLSEVAPHKSALDLGEIKKISNSAKQISKYSQILLTYPAFI